MCVVVVMKMGNKKHKQLITEYSKIKNIIIIIIIVILQQCNPPLAYISTTFHKLNDNNAMQCNSIEDHWQASWKYDILVLEGPWCPWHGGLCPGISTFLYYCKNHYVLLIDLSLQDPSSVQKLGQKLDHILSCCSTVI